MKSYLAVKNQIFLVRIALDAHFSLKMFKNNIPIFSSLSQKFLSRNFLLLTWLLLHYPTPCNHLRSSKVLPRTLCYFPSAHCMLFSTSWKELNSLKSQYWRDPKYVRSAQWSGAYESQFIILKWDHSSNFYYIYLQNILQELFQEGSL